LELLIPVQPLELAKWVVGFVIAAEADAIKSLFCSSFIIHFVFLAKLCCKLRIKLALAATNRSSSTLEMLELNVSLPISVSVSNFALCSFT
jgi:hypothetical protein